MQILEICLYGKNYEIRKVEFKSGTVNIISGTSKTGKSSLIDIVDYCLGKSECSIRAGPVRDTVLWYGVLLQLKKGRMFVARENPIGQISTTAAYVEEGDEIKSLSETPHPNTNVNALIKRLSSKLGISPNLHIPERGRTRESVSASIRHSLVYCYQKQTEIATDRALFHRQEFEGFVANSISDLLEYFLGAVREDSLEIQQKLILAKRDMKRRQRELQEALDLRGEGVSKAVGILAEAKEIGIVSQNKQPKTMEEYVEILETIRNWKYKDVFRRGSNVLDDTQKELQKLKKEIRDIDEKILTTKSFADELKGFTDEVTHQEKRLESLKLFDDEADLEDTCPFCSQLVKEKFPKIQDLKKSLEIIRKNLEMTPQTRPLLREHIYELEEKRQKLVRAIDEKLEAISQLITQEEDLTRIRDQNIRIGEIVGRTKFWLESVSVTDEMSPLQKEVSKAERIVKELDLQINRTVIEAILKRISNSINAQMTEWATKLELEHSGNPVIFDIARLTVGVQKGDEYITLQNMGSGENWLGYHLIVNLALHKYFRENNRPVPSFLFLDQPSQAFYPADKIDKNGNLISQSDPDRIALNRMYNLVFDIVESLKPNFQVIITDHAKLVDNKRFMDNLREEWRNGKALIPLEWITNN